MTCTRCQTEVPPGAAFCPQCGTPAATGGTLSDLGTIAPLGETRTSILTPGTRFADRYEVVRLLGEGGMGVVYLCLDGSTGQELVLKLIRPHLVANELAVKKLIAEGLTARNIRHPNVVAVHDVAQWNGQPYITMEFVRGGSLKSWLVQQRGSDVPLPVATGLVRGILAGLAESHRNNVVHRDLKPDNVLLAGDPSTGDFALKVADFGIARTVTTPVTTGSGGSTGTIGYKAPEQDSAADVVGPQADLYSLSVIFYEILMGNPPRQWESISDSRDDVPKAIDTVIRKGASARQQTRYTSAADYLQALDAALASGRDPARPDGPDRPEPGPPQPPPPPPPPRGSFLSKLQAQWAALSTTAKLATAAGLVTIGVLGTLPETRPDAPPDTRADTAPDGPRADSPDASEPADTPAPPGRSVPPPGTAVSATETFAAGSWRDDAGNRFTAQHDGVNLRAQGMVQGAGPVTIAGTVTRADGAELTIYDARGQALYDGEGAVAMGSGGLDINLVFTYPNGASAGRTTVHLNH